MHFDTPYECPQCDIFVQAQYECPGYGQDPVMVCVPPCGGAIEFTCPICDWWFRHPNNRNATGMGPRPEWIAHAMQEYFPLEEGSDDEVAAAWNQEFLSYE